MGHITEKFASDQDFSGLNVEDDPETVSLKRRRTAAWILAQTDDPEMQKQLAYMVGYAPDPKRLVWKNPRNITRGNRKKKQLLITAEERDNGLAS